VDTRSKDYENNPSVKFGVPYLPKNKYEGWYGQYHPNQGHFACFSPYTTSYEEYNKTFVNNIFKEYRDEKNNSTFSYFAPNTRSVILTYLMYNIPSKYFTHVDMVLENSPTNELVPGRFTVNAFKRSILKGDTMQQFIFAIRNLINLALLFDLIIKFHHAFKTYAQGTKHGIHKARPFAPSNLKKLGKLCIRESLHISEILIHTIRLVFLLQNYQLFDMDPERFRDIHIQEKFYPLDILTWKFQMIQVCEVLSLFLLFIIFLTMMNIEIVSFLFGVFSHVLPSLLVFLSGYFMQLYALAISSLTLFAYRSLKFTTINRCILYTLTSTIYLELRPM